MVNDTGPEKAVRNVWSATPDNIEGFASLSGNTETEVLVIGAGFTGLSAAHHLLEKGFQCVVVDAQQPGWGASGRNGGMIVPRAKRSLPEIEQKWGLAEAQRQWHLLREAVNAVSGLVNHYGIRCNYRQNGYIAAAHSDQALAPLLAEVDWLNRFSSDTDAYALSGAEVDGTIGGGAFKGGYYNALGGTVQPYAYVRGLADGLRNRGVPIYGDSQVDDITQDAGRFVANVAGGRIRADHVIVATNAYTPTTGIPGKLHRRVLPVSSSVVATAPLPAEMARKVIPMGLGMSDTKRLLNWVRLSPDNRIVFGGRGDMTGRSETDNSYSGIERALRDLYPFTAEILITHRWSGRVAMTGDGWHHLGSVVPRLHFAMGYGGRGVAMSALMGRYLADLVAVKPADLGPISNGRFAPIPFHSMRIPLIKAVVAYYRFRDHFSS